MNLVAAVLAGVGLLVAPPVKATLTAPTHTPTVNTTWRYSVHVTKGGQPVAAKITVQIVDPLGGVHPVQYGKTTKNIVRWPVPHGVFSDFVIWPPESRGVPATFRVTVLVGTEKKVLRYSVTPQAAAAPVKATLTAPTHTPKVNTTWRYSVHVTKGGKPVAAKITVQIVDPLGGVHPVEFGKTTKNIVRWPVPHGVFSDFVIWPPESNGVPVTFRVTVFAGTVKKVLRYSVTPHA